jgi:hypothetical protein
VIVCAVADERYAENNAATITKTKRLPEAHQDVGSHSPSFDLVVVIEHASALAADMADNKLRAGVEVGIRGRIAR